jgi:DNA-binding SARP family transcriptional activator
MIQVAVLGGLTLRLEEGFVSGAMTQRRRLALLALLAVARQRGLSRDKIIGYLWPESDAPRARHALNQLLYAQRKVLPGGELFLGGKTLRLNPAEIRTDVGDFEDALDRGDLEAAIALYGGPFLDGFFLKDAPEFERWVEAERHRLARRLCAAYVALANAASVGGDQVRSAEWWRRAAEVDPLDSQIALDVVQALAAAGNLGAALRHAQEHSERLRDELGVAPHPRLVQLVERLRSGGPPERGGSS